MITGLSKKRDGEFDVFQHVLQSVKTDVVEAIGADLVDVYLHIEAPSNSNVTAQQLAVLIASVLPERNVRASILHGSTTGSDTPPALHNGLAAGGWKHKACISSCASKSSTA